MANKKSKKYLGNTWVTRLIQRSNLKQYQNKEQVKIDADIEKKLQDCNIIEFATDPDFLGLSFKERPAQEVILRALYGLPLDQEQLKIFDTLTKNKGKYRPGTELSELIACLGARAGKSFLVSVVALYEATRDKWKQYVSEGENPYIVIIATRQKQAEAIIQANCSRMLLNSPVLQYLVEDSFQTEITLYNGIKILSLPCNSTAGRGLPIAVFILDEIAFYRIEGVKADEIIYNSLRPRQAQFPDCKMLQISTAGSKQGLFFSNFDQGFRIQDRLTIQGTTSFVNPVIPKAFLQKEKDRDIDNWLREFQAEFSEKIEAFFGFEIMQKVFTLAGDLPYKSGNSYYMGFDQSGLSGKDHFAVAISHSEKDLALVDCVRSWDTRNLDIILSEAGALAKKYHIFNCLVDKYAVGYVRNVFKKINLEIEIRPSLPDIFVNFKSLCLREKISLPDRPDLREGMKNSLAVYNKSNKLSIIHERGPEGHADEIDAVVSSIYAVSKKLEDHGPQVRWIGGDSDDDDDGRNWQTVLGDDDDEGFGPLPEHYSQI